MKTSDIALGIAGAVGLYFLAKKLGIVGGAPAVGDGSAFPEGTFRPEDASKQLDFEAVTAGVEDNDVDWLAWIAPPGYDASRNYATSPVDGIAYYDKQLWTPASKISINTLTKGDFDRAGLFLAGAFKRGTEAGCDETEPDKRFRQINAELEDIASGLEIGAAIGTGLASIFGYGAAAQASDKSFGFQRGADETREAQVDLAKLPQAIQVDMAALDVRAAVKKDPDGAPQGKNVLMRGSRPVAAMANLFNISWQKWAEGNAPIDENDLLSDQRGTGTFVSRTDGTVTVNETGISFGLHAGGTIDPDKRHEIIGGQMWLRRGFALPWHSREMGCGLQSLKEKVYVRARMYRCIDLIRSYLIPVEPLLVTAGGLEDDGTGTLVPTTTGKYVTFGYSSPRFGAIRGSLFPPLPEDRAPLSPEITSGFAGTPGQTLSTDLHTTEISTYVALAPGAGLGYRTNEATTYTPPPPPPPAPTVSVVRPPTYSSTSYRAVVKVL